MSTSLTTNISAGITWTLTQALTGLNNPSTSQNNFAYSQGFTNGTGAVGTANLIYAAQIVIAGGGNTVLTFSSGLNDFFGNAMVFARVKILYINLTALTTASSISVGNATHPLPITNTATATIPINNGGICLLGDAGATGMAVGSGATDAIKILNNDGTNSATINFVAVGSTA